MSKMKYRYNRFAQHREQSVFGQNIVIGLATVKHTERCGVKGWALPGCKFTNCPFKAKAAAAEMNRLIHANGGLPAWAAKHVQVAA